VAGLAALIVFLVIQFRYIVVPILVAVLISALLVPFSAFLQRHGWPKWLAVAVALLGTIAVIGGLVTVVVLEVRRGYDDLQVATLAAVDEFRAWLLASPLHIDAGELNAWFEQLWATVQGDTSGLWSGVLSVGSTAGHVLAGALLAIFATLFFLIDGRRIWTFATPTYTQARSRPTTAPAPSLIPAAAGKSQVAASYSSMSMHT
ncbi:MAG: hypothetical protein DI537_55085, partial [Stutzerimonas stutzeri]